MTVIRFSQRETKLSKKLTTHKRELTQLLFLTTMSKVIMGNGGFYGCLSESQCVSARWKETAQIRIRSFAFLVTESPWTSSKVRLLLLIMLIAIAAYAFYTLSWDNLC